ncbi:flagellar hook protein FlgE [Polynucleobacter meluiroseus]|uniref:Flagellar hook protein FlgE n=1 Tax=Polynucleobacter meluiroseus TaxID=1938814 RepID=A0A240E1I9_9BURK|nr:MULTISPECIES: flagellar hook-basal body complex protein [Polynucleobacter]MBU3619504.1 flagellar hook protein FlgE [Polynucleobacter sp. JS-Fieb-80-E5]QWD15051.1 flagellar hook protein FlgE [Polynucleobacter paneuropaeus]SNX28371.1 flagellar hook protein FlgE [Polynucleobacter meluiroseus]
MSLVEGLSGLNAASEHLSVLGNNIANSATVGFKTSSVDFTNVLASHLNAANSGSPVQTGGGVLASNVMQSFTQGPINTTTAPLNAAIVGQGMFVLKDPVLGQTVYTRNGQFTESDTGFLVNGSGFKVLDITGTAIQLPLAPNDIRPGSANTNQVDAIGFNSPLSPYGTVTFGGLSYTNTDGKTLTAAQVASLFSGLQAGDTPDTIAARFSNSATNNYPLFTPANNTVSFNNLAANESITVAGMTFTAGASGATAANVAAAFAGLADGTVKNSVSVTDGVINGTLTGVNTTGAQVSNGALAFTNSNNTTNIQLPVSASNGNTPSVANAAPVRTGLFAGVLSNYNTLAAVPANIPTTYLGQNITPAQQANTSWVQATYTGFGSQPTINVTASGFLTGSNPLVETKTPGTVVAHLNTMAIDETGTIIGTYSDGLTSKIAQIGVATIPSYTGLKAVGNDTWVQSSKSGTPALGTVQLAGSKMQGSALEGSNENQTQDMVALLAAQQAYQASAQVVKIENQIYQTLIGMNG